MSEPVVGVYTIGQTPRPDLTEELTERFQGAHIQLVGALDGMELGDVPPCPVRGYPLETRMQDGTRVVVDAAFVEPRLQAAVDELDGQVAAHLLLCAGPFPELSAPAPVSEAYRPKPLIRPFDVAVSTLRKRGFRSLDVMVPFREQAPPATDKWGEADFACRVHVFAEKPRHRTVPEWLSGLVRGTRAQALVFDYVGFPANMLDEVVAEISLPMFDLGHLALEALEETLKT